MLQYFWHKSGPSLLNAFFERGLESCDELAILFVFGHKHPVKKPFLLNL